MGGLTLGGGVPCVSHSSFPDHLEAISRFDCLLRTSLLGSPQSKTPFKEAVKVHQYGRAVVSEPRGTFTGPGKAFGRA